MRISEKTGSWAVVAEPPTRSAARTRGLLLKFMPVIVLVVLVAGDRVRQPQLPAPEQHLDGAGLRGADHDPGRRRDAGDPVRRDRPLHRRDGLDGVGARRPVDPGARRLGRRRRRVVCALAGLLQGAIHVIAQVPSFLVTLGGWPCGRASRSWPPGRPRSASPARRWTGRSRRIGDARIPSAVRRHRHPGARVRRGAAVHPRPPLAHRDRQLGACRSAGRAPRGADQARGLHDLGSCAGFAGVMLVGRTFSGAPTLADSLLLPVVAAIVVGGTAITGGFGGIGGPSSAC